MILTRKPFVTSFLVTFFLFDIGFCQSPATPGEPEASTVEPDAAPGCKAPQIRINPPPAKTNHVILEAQVVEVETTPSYLSEDLATTDAVDSFVETINLPPENTPSLNPYQIDGDISAVHELSVGSMSNFETSEFNQDQRNEQQINKKRRAGSGRRRRKENDNGQGRLGTGGGNREARYRRKATWTTESPVSTVKNVEIGKWKEKPIDIDDTYFIDVSDLYKTKSLDKSLKKKLRQKWKKAKNTTTYLESFTKKVSKRDVENVEEDDGNTNIFQRMVNLFRVKRKSGKTTGALSRPKAGGDSGSKSTSRKGDKGGYEEEGYSPIHPEEEDEEEEEEEEDLDAHHHFGDVSEIRFPGEVGPLGDPRLCKIRCIKGKWVGPLCATNEEDKYGNVQFQPLYKSCHVNRIQPHLLLSYRNISVSVGWDLPHGHSLQARCKDLGLYKLLGEAKVLCSNGLWAPRMPSCVPTTLLTNFSDDSPPSVRIKIGSGSGAFEPSGVLAVLPGSILHLDCMYPRARGSPEWSWTSWHKKYSTAWSSNPEEKSTKYRLTIKDITPQDSGSFTCSSPRGLTNSISIVVASSTCPKLPEPVPPLSLRLEGYKLGNRALYRCPLGFTVEGSINSTCLASGNWSSPPPTCQAVQCPALSLEDSHLSLTELNTSAWGKAVFKCQWGFKLNGPSSFECLPNGVWSGTVPRCRAIQCPAPVIPLNGRIDGTSGTSTNRRYSVAALVTFSCNEGHTLEGEASIVCTETGLWSHSPPYCKSQCPYPGDPANGLIAPLKFHYDPGDVLSVTCRSGFVEVSEKSGPPKRPECLPDGNWSIPIPQCRNYEEV